MAGRPLRRARERMLRNGAMDSLEEWDPNVAYSIVYGIVTYSGRAYRMKVETTGSVIRGSELHDRLLEMSSVQGLVPLAIAKTNGPALRGGALFRDARDLAEALGTIDPGITSPGDWHIRCLFIQRIGQQFTALPLLAHLEWCGVSLEDLCRA